MRSKNDVDQPISPVKWETNVPRSVQIREEREKLFGKPGINPKAEIEKNAYYSLHSAATYLRLSEWELRKLIASGKIRIVKLWYKLDGVRAKNYREALFGWTLFHYKKENGK